MATVDELSLVMQGGRYKVNVDQASAGNLVLLGGLDGCVHKTATIFSADASLDSLDVFRPVNFQGVEATVKIACEPLHAAELPKMLDSI
jgi:116 kDa U5 small nuclear ribonucleoprotein component